MRRYHRLLIIAAIILILANAGSLFLPHQTENLPATTDGITALFTYGMYGFFFMIGYVALTAGVLFVVARPGDSGYADQIDGSRFTGDAQSPDRIVLIDERLLVGTSKIHLVQGAVNSLDMTCHAAERGAISNVFFASVLEAADRGVRIRILFDGFFRAYSGLDSLLYGTLSAHPNIQVRVYEPVNLLTPWTLNNRMHDKYMIVDGRTAIIGTSNLGDRYTVDIDENRQTSDREAVILGTSHPTSVIHQFAEYFLQLWNHPFVREKPYGITGIGKKDMVCHQNQLMEQLSKAKIENAHWFYPAIDWTGMSMPVNRITLIHNPITRLNKEPRVLMELAGLMRLSKKNVILQSPYIVPARRIRQYLNLYETDARLTLLTNSLAVNANHFAPAGYQKYKKMILAAAEEVFEYQGPGSIHGKSYVFDDRISLIGSFNIDPRSAFLSTESMVVVDSEPFASALTRSMKELMRNSSLQNKPDDADALDRKADKPVTLRRRLINHFLVFFLSSFEGLI